MPDSLEDQCLGGWSLEICPVPALLSPGFEHLERAILPSSAVDGDSAAVWRDSLSVSRLPL
jgi:hypothetical protein